MSHWIWLRRWTNISDCCNKDYKLLEQPKMNKWLFQLCHTSLYIMQFILSMILVRKSLISNRISVWIYFFQFKTQSITWCWTWESLKQLDDLTNQLQLIQFQLQVGIQDSWPCPAACWTLFQAVFKRFSSSFN